jgi:hypothetical protein
MIVTPAILFTGGQLSNSATALVTAAFNTTGTIITAASFTNTDTVTRAFTVYIVRNGGSPSAANEIIGARQLAPNETYTSLELQNQTLGPGDKLEAFADTANKVTCAGISGYVVTA